MGTCWQLGAPRERRRGAGGEAGATATACGGGSPGKTRNRIPGLVFERGLDGEVEGDTGNPIRGLRGRGGGRRREAAGVFGVHRTATREAGEREKEGGQVTSRPRGAPGGFVRRRGAAERRHGGGPRRDGNGGGDGRGC
jgi:hypothetical protein